MASMICEHCGIKTEVYRKGSAGLFDPALHCRACERSGGMRPAVRDRGSGQWRAKTPTDPQCELSEAAIDGRSLTLVEMMVAADLLAACHRQPGTWLSIEQVTEVVRGAGQPAARRLLCSTVLQQLGLEVEGPGGQFRAPPIGEKREPQITPTGADSKNLSPRT